MASSNGLPLVSPQALAAATGNVLTVGPGQQYATIQAAVAAASAGDTIDVQAGVYTNDFISIFKDLTLQAVGGIVRLVATVVRRTARRSSTRVTPVSRSRSTVSTSAVPPWPTKTAPLFAMKAAALR